MANSVMRSFFLMLFLLSFGVAVYAEGEPTSFQSSDFDFEMDDELDEGLQIWDPLEKVNRPMDRFNRWLMKKLRPVTNAYIKVVPDGGRRGIANFFRNLTAPLDIVNLGLQAKPKRSAQQLGRFLLNSTVGLGGIFDVATTELKIPPVQEDFGQTFAVYGVRPGPYLSLPFLGPMTTRDFFSMPLDMVLDLDSWLLPHNPPYRYGLTGVKTLEKVSQLQNQMDSLEKDALDPYTFTRDAFWQFREAKVRE